MPFEGDSGVLKTVAGSAPQSLQQYTNQAPGEGSAIFRAVSWLAGGGPGYRFNPLGAMLYLKDKQAWKADVRAHMGREKLLAVVPAHGHVATGETVARTQEILA